MALTKSYDTSYGVTFANAYFKVTRIELEYGKNRGQIEVMIYASEQARQDKKNPIGHLQYMIADYDDKLHPFTDLFGPVKQDEVGENPQKASYSWLKQQPELKDAIDV